MKSHADNLGQAGSPVSTRNLISQVLLGLDEEYNPVVAMIQGRNGITWSEMQAELLVFEKRLELHNTQKSALTFSHNVSVNMVNSNNTGGQRNQNYNGNNRQQSYERGNQRGNGGRGRGRARGYGNFNNNKPICQVCGKTGHTTLACYQRFNKEFSGYQSQNRGEAARQNT